MTICKLTIAVLSLLAPAAARAHDAPGGVDPGPLAGPGGGNGQSDIVVTAAGVAQPVVAVGQSVTLLDRATIERRQTVSLAELLATTPGVTVSRNGGEGGFTAVRIRGAEGEQTLTIIDGVRVNDPSSPGGGFDFGNLLAGSIERIEVLRGPDSVAWGSQALGGVVNIVTTPPSVTPGARARVDYGSHDSLFATAGATGGTGPLRLALDVGRFSTDGISAAAAGRETDGFSQTGGAARAAIDLAPGVGIDLATYYAHSHTSLDGYPPPAYVLADDTEYSTVQEIYGAAGFHADLAGGRAKNHFGFTIADINRDNYDPSAGRAPIFLGRGRSERYSWQGDFSLIRGLRLVAGAERETSRFTDGFTAASTAITSIYGEAILNPVGWLTVTGGVRRDDHRSFGSHDSADASVAAVRGSTVLRVSVAQGFKAPTLYQLYGDYGTRSLRPETALSFDAGVTQRLLDGAVEASATWFHRNTRGQIDFDACAAADVKNAGSICYDRPFGTYANIDRTRAEGVELALAATPLAAFHLVVSYSLIATRNWSAAAAGNRLARRPHDSGSVSLDYVAQPGWSIGATVLAVGHSYDDTANLTRLAGYVVAALRAELPIDGRVALFGRIENLTDERYQTVAGYGTEGRTVHGGVRVRFGG